MEKILEGIRRFQETVYRSKQNLFQKLAQGQRPRALFITCSDSRVDPSLLTQTEPGELFILRNAGNIVPPHGAGPTGEAGTIEYAVDVLGIRNIIVCGHSHCGAMHGLIEPSKLEFLPAVRTWVGYCESTRRIVEATCRDIGDSDARLAAAVETNVLVQLEHLRTHPSVAAALRADRLRLHGWVYEFESGRISIYDEQQRQFVPLGTENPPNYA